MTVSLRLGDTRKLCAELPDASVSLVACSPPFWRLRSYLDAEHDDKGLEIGAEPTPGEFIDTLLELTAEWGRVLAPWGSIAIELGDSYAGSGGAGGDYNAGGMREGQNRFVGTGKERPDRFKGRTSLGTTTSARRDKVAVPRQDIACDALPKSLCLIPQAYALALAYGFNPLNGDPSPAGQWRVRNLVVWHRNNPSPGALADKFRPATSYIIVATRDKARWFDLAAVRTDAQTQPKRTTNGPQSMARRHESPGFPTRIDTNGGSPPIDAWFDEHLCWTINTQPSPLAHFAMWPPSLAERLILSMCPKEVCSQCNEPRRRIEVGKYAGIGGGETERDRQGRGRVKTNGAAGRLNHHDHPPESGWERERSTVGWTSCSCGAPFISGTVLDPFAGAGTTLAVADLHGRDAIGFELNQESIDLYEQRRAECARALFDSPMPDPNQLSML